MIFISDHSRKRISSIEHGNSVFFCGPALDFRGDEIKRKFQPSADVIVLEMKFEVDDYSIEINGIKSPFRRASHTIDDILNSVMERDIIVDITTLGFVELLLILKWFKNTSLTNIQIIYAEPTAYKSRVDYMSDFGKHEFDLTSHSGGFKAIPGFSKAVSTGTKATLIAVLGFERSRLGQLLQLDEGAYVGEILPIFGTPSYQVGWDKHCFFQNVETLKGSSGKPNFVSAYSALDMINRLEYIKESLPDTEIMVAPFGTKPLSLGVAIFLVNNSNIILKYDHPIKKTNGSDGIGRIHLMTVSKNNSSN